MSALQGFLADYFDINENIVVGFYGAKTERYVKQFQKKNGIDQVGYVGKQTRAAVAKACSGNVTPPTLGNGHLIIYQDKNIVIEGDKPESQAKDECKFFVANNSGTIRCTWNGKEISRSSLPTGTPEIKADVDGSYLLNIVYNNLPLSKITLVSVTTGKEFDVDDNVSGSGVVKEADFHNKANDAYYLKVVAHSTGREVARSNTFYIGSEKPGLSCSIWPSKSTYVLGETITFNWSSTNATYAAFVPATFDKDNLSMPGDKLPASGSQQITAHVLGNPSITLAVYGADNTSARCTASVNVIQSSAQSITVTAPNGGESIAVNDITQVKIAWRMDGISTPISIALYKNDQQLFWIEKNVYLDKSPDGTYSYVWAPNAKGPALPALDSGVNSGFKIHITGQKADGTGYVDDKSDAPFGFISTQSSFGTYQGYMNGNLFITTKEISQTDALTNCILNAQNNPDATTRCTWNGIEIYNNGSTATIVFPNQLGNYSISTELRKPESGSKCEMVDDSITDKTLLKGEVCYSIQTAEYRENGSTRGIFITAQKITKGRDIFERYLNFSARPVQIAGKNILRLENHELFWWTGSSVSFDLIFTQEFNVNKDAQGNAHYTYGTATGDNPVTKYLLEQYSPR